MCGVFGVFSPTLLPVISTLQSLLTLLAHRGPDEVGYYTDDKIFLGARRLSIIDVQGGHQPLSNEDGSVWGAQNGEIYNYRELRAELETRGHIFRTHSDTEVIVHAYEEWGANCPRHLRGIFAFAVWNQSRQKLFLARDHFGVKPLYYAELPQGGWVFASEIRPLLKLLPAVRPNRAALRAMLTVGFVPTPHTAFEGVMKLPAAHSLSLTTGRASLERYWSLQFASQPITLAASVEQFKSHLQRAVTEQRMSEVPLGALISGGLDSASIAALLQAQATEPVHTFNIGFEQATYDEARYATLAARHIGTQHHQVTFRAADFESYPEVMAHLEEPQCSATALPIYLLYQACRAVGLTVILTGEGADELLGGYHWFRGDLLARQLMPLPSVFRRALAESPFLISLAARNVLRAGTPALVERYMLWHGAGEFSNLLTADFTNTPDPLIDWGQYIPATDDPFRQFQSLEMHTRLTDFINFEVDRMSMAHSIEARVPFLDYKLWETLAAWPSFVFMSGEPKRILRDALRSVLPAAILNRRKQGLAAPYGLWLRQARLPAWAEEALGERAIREAGYFRVEQVQGLRAAHQAGQHNHARLLMGVLSTQEWHRQFIKPS